MSGLSFSMMWKSCIWTCHVRLGVRLKFWLLALCFNLSSTLPGYIHFHIHFHTFSCLEYFSPGVGFLPLSKSNSRPSCKYFLQIFPATLSWTDPFHCLRYVALAHILKIFICFCSLMLMCCAFCAFHFSLLHLFIVTCIAWVVLSCIDTSSDHEWPA